MAAGDRQAGTRGPAPLVAALLGLVLLSACTQSTVFYGAQAHELHGKRLLLLRPVLIAPTDPALQQHVLERTDGALAQLPGLGPILGRDAPRSRPGVSLAVVDAYEQFSSTLSLAGIGDPELARVLLDGLQAELLILVQPTTVPCPVCEQGDELWLVGEVLEARTGRLVFRAHLRGPVGADDAPAQLALANALIDEFLDYLRQAFRLRAHRERFTHLKALAAQ